MDFTKYAFLIAVKSLDDLRVFYNTNNRKYILLQKKLP